MSVAGTTRRTSPATPAQRHLRAALTAVIEPGEIAMARRIVAEGVEATWADLVAGDAALDPTGTRRDRAARVDPASILDRGLAAGMRFVVPGDREWPESLEVLDASLAMPDPVAPPFGLWIRGAGDLAALTARAVAIVGARAATAYGDRTASDLAAELTELGWTVVSGGAYGIDAAAHRGALAVGGPTVAVLACGTDIAYPRAHAGLFDRIGEFGAVLSEHAPSTRPAQQRFLLRNRLIAGLTAGTVVVEAARRSGALNTATWADQLGRGVAAVPGPVTSSLSEGCHVLVRERGATLVTNADEVVDLIGAWGDDAVAGDQQLRAAASAQRDLDRRLDRVGILAREVHDHLPSPPHRIDVEALAATADRSVGEVDAALAELAAHELVGGDDADTWTRAAP